MEAVERGEGERKLQLGARPAGVEMAMSWRLLSAEYYTGHGYVNIRVNGAHLRPFSNFRDVCASKSRQKQPRRLLISRADTAPGAANDLKPSKIHHFLMES